MTSTLEVVEYVRLKTWYGRRYGLRNINTGILVDRTFWSARGALRAAKRHARRHNKNR